MNKTQNQFGDIKISDAFYDDIRAIILEARSSAVRSVDFQRVLMYWKLGECIFVEEQHGNGRGKYGTYLIKNPEGVMISEFGSGFSVRQLEHARQFYRTYPIASALRTQLDWMQMMINSPDYLSRKGITYALRSQLGKCDKTVVIIPIDVQRNHCQTPA